MPLAFIAACDGRFYIVSAGDSRALNTKKHFFSDKHQIAMCIAGSPILKRSEEEDDRDVLYVDHVLTEFFTLLDSINTCPVDEFQKGLAFFFKESYPTYWDCFNEHVTYFYGGFIPSNEEPLKTAIYQHKALKKSDGGSEIIERVCGEGEEAVAYFTNLPSVQTTLNVYLSAHPSLSLEKLFSKYTGTILYDLLPRSCAYANKKEYGEISPYLHYTNLQSGQKREYGVVKYQVDDDASTVSYTRNPKDVPSFVTYPSLHDARQACRDEVESSRAKFLGESDSGSDSEDEEEAQSLLTHAFLSVFRFIKAHPYLTGGAALLSFAFHRASSGEPSIEDTKPPEPATLKR